MNNLHKLQIIVLDWYCMCKKSGETHYRLLLHCERVVEFGFLDVWSRASYAQKGDGAIVAGWRGKFGRNDFNIVWNVISYC
jgi:hypothetical protein